MKGADKSKRRKGEGENEMRKEKIMARKERSQRKGRKGVDRKDRENIGRERRRLLKISSVSDSQQ